MRIAFLLLLLVPCTFRAADKPPAPDTTTHANFIFNHAAYRYLVFTPKTWSPESQLPALILLHGAHGRGDDMLDLWCTFADEHNIILIAPTFF